MECAECGAGAMRIACPLCNGRCGAKAMGRLVTPDTIGHAQPPTPSLSISGQSFTRDAGMSHAFHSAHWDGNCGLPREEQLRLLFLAEQSSPSAVADLLDDLGTG